MKIRILENRENDFVEHLKRMLNDFFTGTPFHFKVSYFVGEDTKGNKGLYFELSSTKTGSIYQNFAPVSSSQTPMDIEDELINKIINDFVLAGVSFINLEKLRSSDFVQEKRGKKLITRHKIYLN